MIAAGVIGTIAATGTTTTLAQGVGIDIGRPAYRERYYRGYHDYDSPRLYSERRYHRGSYAYERRWRDRDWD